MILSIILSTLAVTGVYEFIYDGWSSMPVWITLPLIITISAGVYFLPMMYLIILSVACTAGIVHALIRKHLAAAQVQKVERPRSMLPPLP